MRYMVNLEDDVSYRNFLKKEKLSMELVFLNFFSVNSDNFFKRGGTPFWTVYRRACISLLLFFYYNYQTFFRRNFRLFPDFLWTQFQMVNASRQSGLISKLVLGHINDDRIVSGHVKGFIKNHFINVSFYFIGFGTGLWILSGLDNEMVLEVIWVMKRFRKCFKMV
ncbi:hypothetical protein RCL_jg8643.t1 [Rhizophagus clarus]|uniref:Uncharacterized protein n=1 Tax=Rhizophagus clarus TaxID=94130 RepID=A0A8H3M496_9GLOM|nr:hypothetical protein RCL_jg8643.t1 [Rhizophagus clarus]